MSECRRCSQTLRWRELPNGRWLPLDADGANHFTTCTARPKRDLPRDACVACGSTNVEEGPGAGPHFARLRCLDCQSLRWLPWPK